MYKKILYFILGLLLIADLSYSYYQYSFTPIDGDLPEIFLGSRGFYRVLNDPLGIDALTGDVYPATNRFTAHFITVEYFYAVPMFLRNFMSPMDALYMSMTLMKIFCHIGLVFLISWYVSGLRKFSRETMLLTACIVSPFFLAGDIYTDYLRIIDLKITYTIYYALPLVSLLVFFMPFYRYYTTGKFISARWKYLLFILYSLALVFFGPLTSPIFIIGLGLTIGIPVMLNFFQSSGELGTKVTKAFSSLPKGMYLVAFATAIFSFYSLYIGRNNAENLWESKPLSERFDLMKQGLYECFILFDSGIVQILLAIAVNMLLVYVLYGKQLNKYYLLVAGLIVFSVIYLTLLPFGGYRFYRPLIVRRDTILPVTIILLFLLSTSSILLLYKFKNWKLGIYCALVIGLLHHYSSIDSVLTENTYEKQNIKKIASSREICVPLDNVSPVAMWIPAKTCSESQIAGWFLYELYITNTKKTFYHAPMQ